MGKETNQISGFKETALLFELNLTDNVTNLFW
jgi:hypothetical protein